MTALCHGKRGLLLALILLASALLLPSRSRALSLAPGTKLVPPPPPRPDTSRYLLLEIGAPRSHHHHHHSGHSEHGFQVGGGAAREVSPLRQGGMGRGGRWSGGWGWQHGAGAGGGGWKKKEGKINTQKARKSSSGWGMAGMGMMPGGGGWRRRSSSNKGSRKAGGGGLRTLVKPKGGGGGKEGGSAGLKVEAEKLQKMKKKSGWSSGRGGDGSKWSWKQVRARSSRGPAKVTLEQSDLAKVAEVDESIMNLGLEGKEPRKKGEDDKQGDNGFKN